MYLPTLLSGDRAPSGALPVQEGLGARRVLAWWGALVWRVWFASDGVRELRFTLYFPIVNFIHQKADQYQFPKSIFPADCLIVVGLGIADARHNPGVYIHVALLDVLATPGV